MRLLGQADIGRWGLDTFARYPFTALSISEPDLAGALIRLGQERHRQQVSASACHHMGDFLSPSPLLIGSPLFAVLRQCQRFISHPTTLLTYAQHACASLCRTMHLIIINVCMQWVDCVRENLQFVGLSFTR